MLLPDVVKLRKKPLDILYASFGVLGYGIYLDPVTGREYETLLDAPFFTSFFQANIKGRFLERKTLPYFHRSRLMTEADNDYLHHLTKGHSNKGLVLEYKPITIYNI